MLNHTGQILENIHCSINDPYWQYNRFQENSTSFNVDRNDSSISTIYNNNQLTMLSTYNPVNYLFQNVHPYKMMIDFSWY